MRAEDSPLDPAFARMTKEIDEQRNARAIAESTPAASITIGFRDFSAARRAALPQIFGKVAASSWPATAVRRPSAASVTTSVAVLGGEPDSAIIGHHESAPSRRSAGRNAMRA
jgi:hypothetical protein